MIRVFKMCDGLWYWEGDNKFLSGPFSTQQIATNDSQQPGSLWWAGEPVKALAVPVQ